MTSAIALNDCLQWGAVTAIIIIVAFSIIRKAIRFKQHLKSDSTNCGCGGHSRLRTAQFKTGCKKQISKKQPIKLNPGSYLDFSFGCIRIKSQAYVLFLYHMTTWICYRILHYYPIPG